MSHNRATVISPFPEFPQHQILLITDGILFVDMCSQPGLCSVIYANGCLLTFEYELMAGPSILDAIYKQCNQFKNSHSAPSSNTLKTSGETEKGTEEPKSVTNNGNIAARTSSRQRQGSRHSNNGRLQHRQNSNNSNNSYNDSYQ